MLKIQYYRLILPVTKAETAPRKLTGFLAITLWRDATKNEGQLTNAFLKAQYKLNIVALAEWLAENPFAPPCYQCIKLCNTGL